VLKASDWRSPNRFDALLERHAAGATGGAQTVGSKSPQYEEVKQLIMRALELDEQAARARQCRDEQLAGKIYEELLTVLAPKAETLVASALEDRAFAHFAYGVVLRVLHLFDDAIGQFRKSLVIVPDSTDALLEITLCLAQIGNQTAAEEFARRGIVVAPDSPASWGNLAMILIQNRKKEEAFDAISRAVALDSKDPKNRYILENFHRYFF